MSPPSENHFDGPDAGDLKLIMYRLEKVEEGQRKLEAGQTEILDELRKVPRCPNPGLCTVVHKGLDDIEKATEDLAARVRTLEDDRARVQGAGWATKIIWGLVVTLCTSGVIGFIYTVSQHVTK